MLHDIYTRPLKDLRISVTDRCNFRCTYCMPFDEYEWIDKREILTFEEITRLADLFVQLGVDKIRLTGGEPLLRRDLEKLISKLSSLNGLEDLCLTTNGEEILEHSPSRDSLVHRRGSTLRLRRPRGDYRQRECEHAADDRRRHDNPGDREAHSDIF